MAGLAMASTAMLAVMGRMQTQLRSITRRTRKSNTSTWSTSASTASPRGTFPRTQTITVRQYVRARACLCVRACVRVCVHVCVCLCAPKHDFSLSREQSCTCLYKSTVEASFQDLAGLCGGELAQILLAGNLDLVKSQDTSNNRQSSKFGQAKQQKKSEIVTDAHKHNTRRSSRPFPKPNEWALTPSSAVST